MGESHWKASEVNSDPTLPVYIAKHDTLDTAKVMVGFNMALWVLERGLPRGLPSSEIRDLRHDITTRSPHGPVRPQISNFSESLQSHPVISRVNGGAGLSTEMPCMDGWWLTMTWGVI